MEADSAVHAITSDDEWIGPINDACLQFDINTDDRLVAFLANCAHESAGFTTLTESLHYSSSRLLAVFPKYFTPAEAIEFAYDDVRIGERIYGGRMGNGPEGVGDGYLFRGRGLLQITGRGMYAKCGRAIGVDLETEPERLAQPTYAALSAGWFWAEEKLCNALADEGKTQSICLRINGGVAGLQERIAWAEKIRAAIA